MTQPTDNSADTPINKAIQGLCDDVQYAYQNEQALCIQGGNSKSFYASQIHGTPISTSALNGIIEYQPSELYLTAYAGTPLQDIEAALTEHQQMLSFEPPQFTPAATLGGAVACGLSGPRRPYADALRDCVLGTQIINGKGELLTFGGKVMKNVAGYDVSKLMCGAFGTLGLLTQISVKVLPKPANEITLSFECDANQAVTHLQQWLHALIPITASYFHNNQLCIRIAGLSSSVDKIKTQLGGEEISASAAFWQSITHHKAEFFNTHQPLWRCIVPPNTTTLGLDGDSCFEWHGGLHWLISDAPADTVFAACHAMRGHATLFRADTKPDDCFAPMNDHLQQLHLKLKQAFDPQQVFNRQRMYSWC